MVPADQYAIARCHNCPDQVGLLPFREVCVNDKTGAPFACCGRRLGLVAPAAVAKIAEGPSGLAPACPPRGLK